MDPLIEDFIKVSFSKDKPKWKKMKLSLTDSEIVLQDKDTKIEKIYDSVSVSESPKNLIFSINDKSNNDTILIRCDKKFSDFEKILQTKLELDALDDESISPDLLTAESSNFLSFGKSIKKSIFTPMTLKKSKTKDRLNSEPSPVGTKIFGGNLADIYAANNNEFPSFLEELITNIENKGLSVSGIYRESGELVVVKELKETIENGQPLELRSCPIHAQTATVKLFFRELESKVIPREIFQVYTSGKGKDERFNAMLVLLEELPFPNRSILFKLINHFEKIKRNSESNKMTFYNISVVFGPTLIDCDISDISLTADALDLILSFKSKLLQSKKFMDGLKLPDLPIKLGAPPRMGSKSYAPPLVKLRPQTLNVADANNRGGTIDNGRKKSASNLERPNINNENKDAIRPFDTLRRLRENSDERTKKRFQLVTAPDGTFCLVIDEEASEK